MPINVNTMADVHLWVDEQLNKNNFLHALKAAGKDGHKAFLNIKSTTHAGHLLRFFAHLGTRQPMRLVWSDHHAYCVKVILAKHGWSEDEQEMYAEACKSLALHTGGKYLEVDYVKMAKNDRAVNLELSRLAVTYNTDDIEDTAIVQMAVDSQCDLIVSNDNGILCSRSGRLVWKLEDTYANFTRAMRPKEPTSIAA